MNEAMRKVPLPSFSEVSALLNYNPETGLFSWKTKRSTRIEAGSPAGCRNKRGYITIGINGWNYQAHRLAWLLSHGEWPENQVDHINGDYADNRIANLRDVPQELNQQNIRRARCHSKSGLLGAMPHKGTGKWQSQIMVNGTRKYLGLFPSPEAAHEAYLAAKRQFHPSSPLAQLEADKP